MALKIFAPQGSARLAIAGLALCMGLAHTQTVSAQSSKYGSPFGSYGGYKNKQYDSYKEYGKPSPSEDRGEMVPFRRGGGPLLAVVALDAQRITVYDHNGRLMQQSPGFDGHERL